jgi:hypothetical protein
LPSALVSILTFVDLCSVLGHGNQEQAGSLNVICPKVLIPTYCAFGVNQSLTFRRVLPPKGTMSMGKISMSGT